ncbi:MAG: ATP-binding protein [Chitinophagaceae bacterium]
MKKNLLVIAFLFFVVNGIAQPFNVDSLRKKIETSNPDTVRVRMLGTLSTYYNHNHLDSGFYFVRQMITLSQQLKYTYGEAWGLSILSTSADRTGDMAKSLEIALSCLHLAEKLAYGKEEMFCRAYTQLGVVNFLNNHYDQSRSYLHIALAFAKKVYPNETFYYQIYSHLGNTFRRQGLLDSSLYYNQKAYALSLHSNVVFFFPYVRNCYGDIETALGKMSDAIQFYHSAIAEGLRVNHQFQLSYSYSQISAVFNKIGKPDSCIYFAKKSLELSQRYYFGTFIPEAANQLALAFETLHQPDSALKYLRITMDVKDKVMNQTKQQQFQLLEFEEQQRKEKLLAENQEFKNKVRTVVLIAAVVILLVSMIFLYRNNLAKQKSNIRLTDKTEQLEKAMQHLRQAQSQLVHAEKMASLGELTAGIAHEIQNPLNFVNNFAEINRDLIGELKEEIKKGNIGEVSAIADDIDANHEKINHHGKRADAIVKGMLQHSRRDSGTKELTDINRLADEYLRLSYQGLRAKDKSFNAVMKTDFDKSIDKINIIPQDIGRVLLNLYNNAFYAAALPSKGGFSDSDKRIDPTIWVSTKKLGDKVLISVRDNGDGIPKNTIDKIFQPFFTTKPAGQGTGLGLSLSYDIIKAHGGEIKVETEEGKGSEFIITLPVV